MSRLSGATACDRVFGPITLGPVEVANRIYFAPHGLPLSRPCPATRLIANRLSTMRNTLRAAAGGVGLIFIPPLLGTVATQSSVRVSPTLPESIPSYRRRAEVVRANGRPGSWASTTCMMSHLRIR